jgi:hypothetical protein
MATTPIPQPAAIDGVVTNDVATRTLVVRRPEDASGYQKLLWREAHQALVAAAESGWLTERSAARNRAGVPPEARGPSPGPST